MMIAKRLLFVPILLISTTCWAKPLKSPWDGQPVASTDAAYNCAVPAELGPEISVLKSDLLDGDGVASAETKAGAYAESSMALRDSTARFVYAADAYRQTGSLNAARCVITTLLAAAADHAWTGWMQSRAAIFEQSIGLRGAAIAYLKVAGSGVATPEQSAQIASWMAQIASEQRRFYSKAKCEHGQRCVSHHALAAAQSIALVAMIRDDKGSFGWAMGRYRDSVKEIDEHGMLPGDLHGRWTLKFELEAAASLVQIAEYAAVNGVDLYGYDHGAVHALVKVSTRALLAPNVYAQQVQHVPQEMPKDVEGWQIAWATPYVRRFPDPVIAGLIHQSNGKGLYEWGGLPIT